MRYGMAGYYFAKAIYIISRQAQKRRTAEQCRRHAETWRIVREQAAKSRLEHQQNRNNLLTTPRRNSTHHDS